jgi:type IV pilus assembly protein PilE
VAPKYTITVVTPTPGTYTLSATPVNPGPMAGDPCGTLTLDSTGLRGRTGAADINLCWGR